MARDAEPDLAGDRRSGQVAANLATVRGRIAAACHLAGRPPTGITLIAVTKTFPVSDVRRLAACGVADFGENRDQEARVKAAEVPGVRWHFVGRLQRNKVASVVRYADVVHSVDRSSLVEALDAAAVHLRGRPLDVLVQVDLDERDDPGRGGARPADVPGLAAHVADTSRLRLAGVMAVAPRGGDPDTAFARLAEVSAGVRALYPDARIVSAGMSGDLEAAITHGATHVRVGTALLGGRENLVR